jgi:hypothetical protein
VLKTGGCLLGTADSGSTFIQSFFHTTPWGVIAMLCPCGLDVVRMWITKDILTFVATNPGYPRVIRVMLRILARIARVPILSPRSFLKRTIDPFVTAGSVAFVAVKNRSVRSACSPFSIEKE